MTNLLTKLLNSTILFIIFMALIGIQSPINAAPIRVAYPIGNMDPFIDAFQGTQIELHKVSATQIQNGALESDDYDVVLMPGGLSTQQHKLLGPVGIEKVKDFVNNGGGYAGFCAGAYLGSYSGVKTAIGLANLRVVEPTDPGIGDMPVQFMPDAANIIKDSIFQYPKIRPMLHYNGPLWATSPATDSRPPVHVIAKFTGEGSTDKFSGNFFKDRPDLIYDYYGKGCVFLSSSHPELADKRLNNNELLPDVFEWLASCDSDGPTIAPTGGNTPTPTGSSIGRNTPTPTIKTTPIPTPIKAPQPTGISPVGDITTCNVADWICRGPDVMVPPVRCDGVNINTTDSSVTSCITCASNYPYPQPSTWKCPTDQDAGQKDGTGLVAGAKTYYQFDYEQGNLINVPPVGFGSGGPAISPTAVPTINQPSLPTSTPATGRSTPTPTPTRPVPSLPPGGTTPANRQTNDITRRVLKWISTLSSRTDNKVMAGQHLGAIHTSVEITYDQFIGGLYNKTDKWAAIVGVDYGQGATAAKIKDANRYLIRSWNEGHLIALTIHGNNPWTGGNMRDLTGRNLKDLTTPGTPAYIAWHKDLDLWATGLAELRDAGVTVIWRPFHEMNFRDTFWWDTGAFLNDHPEQGPEVWKDMWKEMFSYFSNPNGWNLNNLIWVYSAANYGGDVNLVYPGNDYVDMVGMDVYMDSISIRNGYYDKLLQWGKPFALTETGPDTRDGSWDTRNIINSVRSRYPRVTYFLEWQTWTNNKVALVDNQFPRELLNDPWVITRDEVAW